MPHRPRQHVLEDLARADLHRVFSECAWTVEDLTKDYGEDLLVRIFSNEQATPLSFFVQSKATDKIKINERDGREFVVIRLSSSHLRHWQNFWQPVVVAVYDAASGATYWEIVQDALPTKDDDLGLTRKTATLAISTTNKLDAEGLRRLKNRTRARFERFQSQKEGAEVLMEVVREKTGLNIGYDPEAGILTIPKGKFVCAEPEELHVVTFGRMASLVQSLCDRTGLSPDAVAANAIDVLLQATTSFRNGGVLQVRSKEGEVLEEYKSAEQLHEHLRRQDLERDELKAPKQQESGAASNTESNPSS